jgi:hypothetical protein
MVKRTKLKHHCWIFGVGTADAVTPLIQSSLPSNLFQCTESLLSRRNVSQVDNWACGLMLACRL